MQASAYHGCMSLSLILMAAIAGLIVVTGVVVLSAQMSSKEER